MPAGDASGESESEAKRKRRSPEKGNDAGADESDDSEGVKSDRSKSKDRKGERDKRKKRDRREDRDRDRKKGDRRDRDRDRSRSRREKKRSRSRRGKRSRSKRSRRRSRSRKSRSRRSRRRAGRSNPVAASGSHRTKWEADADDSVPDWLEDIVPKPPPKPPPGVSADDFKQVTMQCAQIRALIGKGGETIREIRSKSGSDVKIDHVPGEFEGTVTIIGDIEETEKLIADALQAKGCPLGAPPPPPQSRRVPVPQLTSTSLASSGLLGSMSGMEELLLPPDLVQRLTAPGTNYIEDIRQKSGGNCFISVVPSTLPGSLQNIRIMGGGRAEARALLEAKIVELKATQMQAFPPPPLSMRPPTVVLPPLGNSGSPMMPPGGVLPHGFLPPLGLAPVPLPQTGVPPPPRLPQHGMMLQHGIAAPHCVPQLGMMSPPGVSQFGMSASGMPLSGMMPPPGLAPPGAVPPPPPWGFSLDLSGASPAAGGSSPHAGIMVSGGHSSGLLAKAAAVSPPAGTPNGSASEPPKALTLAQKLLSAANAACIESSS